MKRNRIYWMVACVLAIALVGYGCSQLIEQGSPMGSENALNPTSDSTNVKPNSDIVQPASIGGYMVIAWPFSSLQLLRDWTGWEGDRTSGSTVGAPFCNGRPSTHSGAEYYARDLNQKNGLDYGIMIFSGIAGRIVKAGLQNGYGYTVVVYDPVRRVAVRYAHLSSIYSAAYEGRNIPAHFYLGRTGSSGNVQGTHLHVVGYENINDNNGNPVIPTLCDSDYYACRISFYWWTY